jgi:DNA-binding GntR family transcriptional regulator
MKTSISEHQKITHAIAMGEQDQAKDLLARHVSSAYARLKQSMPPEPTTPIQNQPEETT